MATAFLPMLITQRAKQCRPESNASLGLFSGKVVIAYGIPSPLPNAHPSTCRRCRQRGVHERLDLSLARPGDDATQLLVAVQDDKGRAARDV